MSYTQGTTHYNLPQTLGDDKRDWFDTNQPFADVDAALYSAYEGVQTLDKDLTAVKSDLNTAQTDIANIKQYDAENTVKVSALETLTAQHTVDIEDVRNDAEDMICSVEEKTATAQYEHLTGAYFRYNDTLYVATTDISKGDTIVPNVNCRTTDVSSRIGLEKLESVSIEPNDYFTIHDSGTVVRNGNLVSINFSVAALQHISSGTFINLKLNIPDPAVYLYQTDLKLFFAVVPGYSDHNLTLSPQEDINKEGSISMSILYMCK